MSIEELAKLNAYDLSMECHKALGKEPYIDEWGCFSPDGTGICMTDPYRDACERWLNGLPEKSPYRKYIIKPIYKCPWYASDLNAAMSLLETDADFIPIHSFNIADFVRCLALLTGVEVDEEPETCDFFRFLKASPKQITVAFIAVKQQPVEVKGGGE